MLRKLQMLGFELELFNYQSSLTSNQDASIAASADISSNLIRLYKAIGGGWVCEDAIIDSCGNVVSDPTSSSIVQVISSEQGSGSEQVVYPVPPKPAFESRTAAEYSSDGN